MQWRNQSFTSWVRPEWEAKWWRASSYGSRSNVPIGWRATYRKKNINASQVALDSVSGLVNFTLIFRI